MRLGGQYITGRTFRAYVKHGIEAGWQMWDWEGGRMEEMGATSSERERHFRIWSAPA